MPETNTTLGAVPISEIVPHMRDVIEKVGGFELTAEAAEERKGAVDELRACFPGADAETLVRIAAYIADLGLGMERALLDGYAIAWGYAQFATVLAEDL